MAPLVGSKKCSLTSARKGQPPIAEEPFLYMVVRHGRRRANSKKRSTKYPLFWESRSKIAPGPIETHGESKNLQGGKERI